MLRGLPASVMIHAAVFGASYLTLPFWAVQPQDYSVIEAVDVNFAEIGEITNIAPIIEREGEPPEEVAPEPPEEDPPEDPVEEDLPEAEMDVASIEETVPVEPDPEDVMPNLEPEEPEETPEPEPEPEPEPKTERQRSQTDLMDLLNQSESTFQSEIETRRERPEPPPPVEQPQTALENVPIPAETRNRAGAGERNANTARLEALVQSRIRNECWSGVDDLPNPELYNVHMNVRLNENGTIAELTVVEPKGRPRSYMATAVERARRAVGKCEPFRLPKDDYELWKEINVYLGLGYASN
ncbi:MAG: cell envelope integrity protein TolA [Pseudomonadota bacterium]